MPKTTFHITISNRAHDPKAYIKHLTAQLYAETAAADRQPLPAEAINEAAHEDWTDYWTGPGAYDTPLAAARALRAAATATGQHPTIVEIHFRDVRTALADLFGENTEAPA